MIWILGCQGMLGTELGHVLSDAGIAHVGTDRDCDVTEPGALRQFASAKGISWIVNCSSYTNVDRAEDEPELAYRINAVGARNAAAVAREVGARCIYISTDYVFGGLDHAPYREDSTIDPCCS